ncbi:FAD-linked oxidase-like protein [Colletotrichum zoysiae]|uniref:FAD-linked oxidase-like protein n=1 Tax=Colletotrichum zoysiae TaxID=1216348 RepID=A0AAD9M2H4_9PEZI|nr:FAD-linked oxidase-like protein [Colletotrichum zoysiae]
MSASAQVLPPGITPSVHRQFFDEVAAVLGNENISRDASSGALVGPHNQNTYGDAYPMVSGNEHTPSGAVRPSTVEELQQVLRLANRFRVPLWTVSRGRNLGYGGSSPVVEGTVVLDLHRMNRVVEINEQDGYAIVEPGVSFFDLYEEIKRRGLALWPSCAAIGWGSVLGNTLDHGFGYTPDGVHTEAQCGMEVVLPSGELLRTGMGAVDNSKLWALYKPGFGPSVDGLFYQSNLGVVTKIGMHICPAPEAYTACELSVPNEEDLGPLIALVADLQRRNVISNHPSVSNVFRQAILSPDDACKAKLAPYFGPNKHVPESVLNELKATYGWGFWKAEFGLQGAADVVPAMERALRRAITKIPGSKLVTKQFGGTPGKLLRADEVETTGIPHTGVPTTEALSLMDYRLTPGSGHTCVAPVVPTSGSALYEWYLAAKEMVTAANFDFFADFHAYSRYIIPIILFVFAPEEKVRANELYMKLTEDAARRGLTEYRTHVAHMDSVRSQFTFNDHALAKLVDGFKASLDPNGILSPGKSGIHGPAPKSTTSHL